MCAMIFDRVDVLLQMLSSKKKRLRGLWEVFHEKKKGEEEGSITSNFLFLV